MAFCYILQDRGQFKQSTYLFLSIQTNETTYLFRQCCNVVSQIFSHSVNDIPSSRTAQKNRRLLVLTFFTVSHLKQCNLRHKLKFLRARLTQHSSIPLRWHKLVPVKRSIISLSCRNSETLS